MRALISKRGKEILKDPIKSNALMKAIMDVDNRDSLSQGKSIDIEFKATDANGKVGVVEIMQVKFVNTI